MDDGISICMTMLGDRAGFLDDKLGRLAAMDFPCRRKLEVCVTDGTPEGGSSELRRVLKKHARKFARTVYALSLRSKLPFKIPHNNPACDINAQVCNVAGREKIVRTDAEVAFTNRRSLRLVDEVLDEEGTCLTFRTHLARKPFVFPRDVRWLDKRGPERSRYWSHVFTHAFFCSCFRRRDFVANGGVDERFAVGYAGEDTWFHLWWERNRKLAIAPQEHATVHLWHPDTMIELGPSRWPKVRAEYTLPLMEHLRKTNEVPNTGNPDWQRPEMIEDVREWTS